MKTALMWFRRDLRLTDNTALLEATMEAERVVPLFIFDPCILDSPDTGSRRVGFLIACLESLDKNLRHVGGRLVVRQGEPLEVLRAVVSEAGASAVFFNADSECYARRRDESVTAWAKGTGVVVRSFEDQCIHPPGQVLKKDGTPYTVFTPFSRAWREQSTPRPRPAPKVIKVPPEVFSDPLPRADALKHPVDIDLPPAGERAALDRMKAFMAGPVGTYQSTRNLPALDTTSRLSPYLRFGVISARTVLTAAQRALAEEPGSAAEIGAFVNELIWRDFYKHILHHFPHVETGAFRREYDAIEWPNDRRLFTAWCEGRTGYPIVDAAMRQLNTTGWMHNRLRMITASFLTKDLLVDWKWGERYFMKQLLDGDLAANNGGWQWAAGTGTDAQPYFRIFNPASQTAKFDAREEFIRKYIPELDTPDYPRPVISHAEQRNKALALYKAVRAAGDKS
jgi:deoxyribodipyrimidine photo-lyase